MSECQKCGFDGVSLRTEIARLRREKEILAIAIQLATREKAELLKQIQLKTQLSGLPRQERNRPLPTTRCDCCDNGLDDAWDFCPFCGRAHPDATETKETHHGK